MVKNLVIALSVLTIAPFLNAGCQNVSVTPEIEVSESVLRTAETFNFKYMEVLTKAKTGDVTSIHEFIRFHKYVDEMDAINHGVACLELIPFATDAKFANACRIAKPNLCKVLAERLAQAQGRTKKENLRKPIKEWAPLTWAALIAHDPSAPAPEGVVPSISNPDGQPKTKPGTVPAKPIPVDGEQAVPQGAQSGGK